MMIGVLPMHSSPHVSFIRWWLVDAIGFESCVYIVHWWGEMVLYTAVGVGWWWLVVLVVILFWCCCMFVNGAANLTY